MYSFEILTVYKFEVIKSRLTQMLNPLKFVCRMTKVIKIILVLYFVFLFEIIIIITYLLTNCSTEHNYRWVE